MYPKNLTVGNRPILNEIKMDEVLTQFGTILDESQSKLTKPSQTQNLGIIIELKNNTKI